LGLQLKEGSLDEYDEKMSDLIDLAGCNSLVARKDELVSSLVRFIVVGRKTEALNQ